jgi:hypothetical protein
MRSIALTAAVALALAAPVGAPALASAENDHGVIELRQYKIVTGKRDAFIDFFERHFVESQEVLGMRLIGQFRDRSDPSRFTWIRGFSSMTMRGKALADFYYGPVWKAQRDTANPMLDDNDDVLLLKPAWPGSEIAPPIARRPPPGGAAAAAGVIVATIEYLWKDPEQGYAAYFRDRLLPMYEAAGLPVLGAYVAENEPNNFPRLHVRQNERVLVWFTRVESPRAYEAAKRKLGSDKASKSDLAAVRQDYLERQPQILTLSPTPRSLLR